MVSVLVRTREEELNPRASQGLAVQVGKQSEVLNFERQKIPLPFKQQRERQQESNVGFIHSLKIDT